MEFRAFVAKAPHLTIPRQRTLVYGGKLIFSNAAAKLPKAISQKRHDGFSFLNDGNLDKCLSKKKIRLATPALWLSSPHWAKCLTKSKFLETACKNYCTHMSAPRHVRVPRSRNFSDCSTPSVGMWNFVQTFPLAIFHEIRWQKSCDFITATVFQIQNLKKLTRKRSSRNGKWLVWQFCLTPWMK